MLVDVYTKQHIKVLEEINKRGRYIAKKENIERDLGDLRKFVLEAYTILSKNPNIINKPNDVEYPIWVSLKEENTMILSKDEVIIKLEIEENLITKINMEKWAIILNLSYIPKNEEDRIRHYKLLKNYNISDTQAFMSQFYPTIKKEIKDSWIRLYDDSIDLFGRNYYGNIWEIKKEFIKEIKYFNEK